MAWTSPTEAVPDEMRKPPTTASRRYWMLPANSITGWMRLARNWAENDALVQLVVRGLGSARSTWRRRPKALTTLWPVKTSSTWAFREPVWRHWVRYRGLSSTRRSGASARSRRGRSARATDGQQWRDGEHHHRDPDQGQQGGEDLTHRLLEALGQIVDVVGDPTDNRSPRGLASTCRPGGGGGSCPRPGTAALASYAGPRRPGARPGRSRGPRRRRTTLRPG